MIAKLLGLVATLARKAATIGQTGLPKTHPLIRFFGPNGANLDNYLALDDLVVMDAFRRICEAPHPALAELARRLRNRALYKTLDLGSFGHDEGVQRREARRIDHAFVDKIKSGQIMKDEDAAVSVYTQIGGDDERAHKRLHILDARKGPVEITDVSAIIRALRDPKKFTRYYFEQEVDRDAARQRKGEHHEGA